MHGLDYEGIILLVKRQPNFNPKAQREKEVLMDRNWPFPGEGAFVQQEEEPKPKP